MTQDEIEQIQNDKGMGDWGIACTVVPENGAGLMRIDYDKKKLHLFVPEEPTEFVIRFACNYIFIGEQMGRCSGTHPFEGINVWN